MSAGDEEVLAQCASYGIHTHGPSGLKAILERGGSANAKSKGGVTAVMIACERGCVAKVKLLLAASPAPEITAVEKKWSFTALHFAAREGNPEIVSLLLKAGADSNKRCKDGLRPGMHAKVAPGGRNKEAAKLLGVGGGAE